MKEASSLTKILACLLGNLHFSFNCLELFWTRSKFSQWLKKPLKFLTTLLTTSLRLLDKVLVEPWGVDMSIQPASSWLKTRDICLHQSSRLGKYATTSTPLNLQPSYFRKCAFRNNGNVLYMRSVWSIYQNWYFEANANKRGIRTHLESEWLQHVTLSSSSCCKIKQETKCNLSANEKDW